MSLYVIGDLQGCLEPLKRLLDAVHYDPAADELWFTGDLVNRGPHSLETLRFVRGLGEGVITVLGNHDLHLLAVEYGPHSPKKKDTLDAILAAPDRPQLLDWLLRRPLLHYDAERHIVLVHAGLHPHWTLDEARTHAAELEAALRGPQREAYFEAMYGNHPARWHKEHQGLDRLRAITNCLTRMRFCDAEGHLDLDYKGAIGGQPRGYVPWFELPGRHAADVHIVFGHWAALGIHRGADVTAIDSGCVWGDRLTAVCFEGDERRFTSVRCD